MQVLATNTQCAFGVGGRIVSLGSRWAVFLRNRLLECADEVSFGLNRRHLQFVMECQMTQGNWMPKSAI
jgi:hypothetical protein